jgi:hypothetical protein
LLDRLAAYDPQSLAPSAAAESATERDGAMLILVTGVPGWCGRGAVRVAGHGRSTARRTVVVHDREYAPLAASERRDRPWLSLYTESDLCRQLQRQWEQQCHDDACAD